MSKLGTALKRYRNAKDMSLQDVATRASMTKAHIWELERGGAVNPTIKTLCCLAIVLDADVAALAELAADDCMKTLKVETETRAFVRPS